MTIAPIQIPGWQQGRDLDFSQLSQLPQVYQKGQQDAARRDALGLLGQGMSARDVSMKLAQAGDLQGAVTLANIDRVTELTPAMKEYTYAQRQGFPGSFMDFRRLVRGANGKAE